MVDVVPPPSPPPPPPPAALWYEGKADAETIGHWQNRGWDAKDPATIALEATKAHRSAERMIGVPADRLIRLPEKTTDEAGWKEVWGKLGMPGDPKDYDLSAVKDTRLADTLRAAVTQARLPKDAAAVVATAIAKHAEAVEAERVAVASSKLDQEKALLKQNWGDKHDFNLLKAMEGARRLGITAEAVKALEGQIGYSAVMDAMRKIGAVSSEDVFHDGGGGRNVATMEGAQARLSELQRDVQWGKRLLSGDAETRREFDSLSRLATGITEIAA